MPPIDEILGADVDSEFIREQKKMLARIERQKQKELKDKEKKESKRLSKSTRDNAMSTKNSGSSSRQEPNGNSNESGSSNKFFKSKTNQGSPPAKIPPSNSPPSNSPPAQSPVHPVRPKLDDTHRKSSEEVIECVFGDSDSSHLNSTLDRSKTPAKNDSRSSLATDLSANSSVKIQLDSSTENESPQKRSEPEKKLPGSTGSAGQTHADHNKSNDHAIDGKSVTDTRSSQKKESQTKNQMKSSQTNGSQTKNNQKLDSQTNGSQTKSVETGKQVVANEDRHKEKKTNENEKKKDKKMAKEDATDRVQRMETEPSENKSKETGSAEKKSKENRKANLKENAKQAGKEAPSSKEASGKETGGKEASTKESQAIEQTEQPAKARPKRGIENRSSEPAVSETPLSKRRRTCTLKDDPLRFVKPVSTPTIGVRVGLSRRKSVKTSLHPEVYKDLSRT